MTKAASMWNSAGASRAAGIARQVSSGMHLKSSGFALAAGAGAAAGGAAGYAASDGDMSGAAKGAALGVLGVAGFRGIQSARSSYNGGLLRDGVSSAKSWASGKWQNGMLQARLGAMELEQRSTSAAVTAGSVGKRMSSRGAAEADRAFWRANPNG
jgi:hypothetical protein